MSSASSRKVKAREGAGARLNLTAKPLHYFLFPFYCFTSRVNFRLPDKAAWQGLKLSMPYATGLKQIPGLEVHFSDIMWNLENWSCIDLLISRNRSVPTPLFCSYYKSVVLLGGLPAAKGVQGEVCAVKRRWGGASPSIIWNEIHKEVDSGCGKDRWRINRFLQRVEGGNSGKTPSISSSCLGEVGSCKIVKHLFYEASDS